MRNLTIKRSKAYAACLVKEKVYIEDRMYPDIKINKVPCRKLGTIKNGEQKTFAIDENAARVYVIVNKSTKEFSNDYYPIPAGSDDVFLFGEQHMGIFTNSFRFSGLDDNEEIRKHRKENTKKAVIRHIVALAIAIVLSFIIAFVGAFFGTGMEGAPQTFEADGVSITLNDSFWESELEGYDVCCESMDSTVVALKESFADFPEAEEYTIDEYAQLVIKNTANGALTDINVQHKDDLTYFVYDHTDEYYNDYTSYVCVYKTDDAFWIVSFAAYKEDFEEYLPLFENWAKSVEFKGKSVNSNTI